MWWPAIGGADHRHRRADRAARARRRLRRHRPAADRPGRALADRRHPDRQDADLVALARLGHLRRRARAGVHDRRRARRPRGATCCPHVFPGFWAMAGLAAVVGGVMRSPLTGVVFTLELTHAWNDAAAAAGRLGQRLPAVGAAAQALGADREDRPPRPPPDPRILHRPARDLLRPRGHDHRPGRAAPPTRRSATSCPPRPTSIGAARPRRSTPSSMRAAPSPGWSPTASCSPRPATNQAGPHRRRTRPPAEDLDQRRPDAARGCQRLRRERHHPGARR